MCAEHGVALDYSPASLAQLEHLMDGALNGRTDLWGPIGAYVGEVMVRNLGGRWDFNHEQGAAGVHLGGLSWAFPLHKAERRLAQGPEESLASLYRVVELIRSDA